MIDRLFQRIAEGSIARPRRALALSAVAVLAALPGLWRLEVRTDGHALVPRSSPAVRFDREVRAHFGLRDPLVVVVDTSRPGGIYDPATLRRVQRLTDALAALPEVGPDHVMSLATERRDRVVPGTLTFRTFLDPLPESSELLERLRGDVAAAHILTGTLVSVDAAAAAILVGVPDAFDPGDAASFYRRRSELHERVLETVAAHPGEGGVLVVGAPVAEVLLGRHILEDLTLLVPLALAVVAVVVWVGCRRLWGVALGLTEVGACLAWTFGLMGWLGVPVYLTTAVLPVILTTVGLADEIHVFWRYQRLIDDGTRAHGQAVRETLRQMTPPVVLTSLTTAAGFLSFLASPIAPVRAFGAFAGAGVLFCMLWSLTAIPAALALIAPARMRRPTRGSWPAPPEWLSAALERRPSPVLAALGLLTLGLGAGVARLHVQDSWIEGFAPGSPFRAATSRVDAAFHGTHVLLVHLTFDASGAAPPGGLPPGRGPVGPLLDPARLRAVGELEEFLRGRPEVGGVLGPYGHLATVQYLWLARRQGARSIPDDPRSIQRILQRFDGVRGERRRREVIDDALRRAVVSVFLENANYRQTASLMAAVRDYERRHLGPLGVRVDFAGDVAVSQAMIPAIVETQVGSLLLALAGAAAAVSLLRRSLAAGLLTVAPAAVAVLWVFGAMGWLGMPLGVATSMFCAITLGIGVDYGVHFSDGCRRARAEGRPSPVRRALEESGPAIVTDCLAIVLGFGLLGFSQVPANARLGALVALALAACCVLTLAGLGALLRLGIGAERGSR